MTAALPAPIPAPTNHPGKTTAQTHLGKTTGKAAPQCQAKHKRNQINVCTVTYNGKEVEIMGEQVTSVGNLFMVTQAKGLPAGEYYVKKQLGKHEIELTMKIGLGVAHNTATKLEDQCLVMHVVGKHIRNLASYLLEARRGEKECEEWVDKKLVIVEKQIQHMRSVIGQYAHCDLHPGNTRWLSEESAVIIDYGSAKFPCTVEDGHGGHVDLDGVQYLKRSWIGELCAVDRGKSVPELPKKKIDENGCVVM
ncbi:hypothetical protein FRC17_002118 [Serendipita sp. 399]|nr:hypothetical protein FRC17_002118 [Serendipita sp. 399]